MTILAILHPTDLIGVELREAFDRRREQWQEMRLFSTKAQEIGTLAEVRGEATVIKPLDEDSFDGVDTILLCGPIAANRPVLETLPPAATVILLSSDAAPSDGHPVVSPVNLHTADRSRPLLSPHPGVVGLTHLLYPLLPLGLERAVATLLEPISIYGTAGLEEALDQARRMLNFEPRPKGILPAQMVFNLLPQCDGVEHLRSHLATVLDDDLPLNVQVIQAGIFHGLGISLYVQFTEDPGLAEIRDALEGHLTNELVDDPELLGSLDAAARDEVLIGPITTAPGQPGGYGLWAVMDGLTCGGALNALQILDATRLHVIH